MARRKPRKTGRKTSKNVRKTERRSTAGTYRQRDPKVTSRIMSSIRSTNNRVEKKLRLELFRRGFRYRKNVVTLPGKPDIVFARAKVVVFVDGDYWHGRILSENGVRGLRRLFKTPNKAYWIAKIVGNAARDKRVTNQLRDDGWIVLRFWESDLRGDLERCVKKLERAVSSQQRIHSKTRIATKNKRSRAS